MAKYKCKMCGAPLDVSEGQTVITCDFCQSKQTVANANDERKENLFNRANSLRAACDFDKAILAYQSILSIFPSEPEAHWGLCLCKYGIEYVDDPSTHKKIPTIHRMSFDSILKDSDYLAALSYADAIAREEYQEEASQIANIQKNILSISQKEEPFDVFICYKETTETGKRTPDSVLAQEVYSNLTDRGYKVFFSRITLESKLGSMYEPYIFAALNSAKIMLVFGTKKEYFEAVWAKNEWSRFIDMMKTRPDHYLIPCYRDMDAYEMPEQFLSFQGQDMAKLGFMQDLIRGIDKIMGRSDAPKVQAETKIIQTDVNVPALLNRAEILIGDGNFEKADELLERVLDNDPKNSQAYLLKLLIELQLKTVDDLKTLDDTIEGNSNFKKSYDFGDSQQKNKLSSINEFIINRNEEARLGRLYDIAMDYKSSGRYAEAEAAFSEIAGFRDANKQALDCVNLGKEDIYKKATLLKESKEYNEAIKTFEKIKDYKDSEFQISQCRELSDKDKYERAIELKERGMFDEASSLFMENLRYSDSDFQVDECARLKAEATKEAVYITCLFNREINPYFDSSALKKACEKLATIPGYKDSDKLLIQYEGILKDYKAELAKKREVAAREKAKKMKRVKKISFFSAIGALGLTGILLLTFLFLIPSGRQGNIQSLINQGKYDEAMALIDQNGSFGDTENLKNMCYAGQAFERLDYETGIDYIYKIGGSVDVVYDSDGGNASKNTETIKRARGYIDNDPDKSGYDFHGWVLTGYDLEAKSHYASIDLKAQYEIITYTITYSLGGGTCSNLPTEYTTEESVSIPNPTKEGYTFLGWTGLDLSSATIDYSIPVGSTGNKVYTANWKTNDYRIYLNANGGTVDEEYIDVTFDSTYSLPTPSYVGYDFNGWYDEFSKQYSGGIYKTASDVYLNASWNAHSYSITYNLYGGTNDSHNPSCYTIENSDIVLNDPSRDGYTFIGWTTSSINEPTKDIKINSGSTGDLVFNANWSANTYNVTLNLNGGESEKTSYSFVYDSSYEIIAPTRTGYTFNRFEDEDGNIISLTGKWTVAKDLDIFAYWDANPDTKYVINHFTEDLNGGGYTKVNTENLFGFSDKTLTVNSKHYEGFTPVEASKQITVAADGSTVVDFYYTRNSYTITFVLNGGTSFNSETYKYEQQIPSTLKPTRTGFTFAGWYSNEKQTTLFDKMPASDQIVYAYYSEETKASYFDYTFSGQEARITKGNGLSGNIVVPEYIGGKAVTSIGDNAFLNCSAITEITLSDQVQELGAYAFKGCSSLVRINGTSNLETIKDGTFEGCRSLSYFPDLSNVVSIGNNAFKDCSSLTSINISDNLTSIGNYAFQNCVMLLQTPDLTNVTSIGNYAFQGCKLLTEIKSLDGCATFGEGIFTACENIAKLSLSFRESIEQFYVSSFFGRTSSFDSSKYYQTTGKNGSICYIPKVLTDIEYDTTGKTPDYFLYNLSSITKISDKSASSETIGKHAFDGCVALANYTVQNADVSLVDEYGFQDCSSLTSLPEFQLKEVKKYAFANCGSLIALPSLENADYIGDYAFSGCSLITTVKVPSASYMGLNSLDGCSALEELEIPFVGININSTEAFGVIFGTTSYSNSYAATQLSKTYYIPNGLSILTIGGSSIKANSCVNLTSITALIISDSVENIGVSAFKGFNSLESITLPFVGTSDGATGYSSVFGYIFGFRWTSSGEISGGKTTNPVSDQFVNTKYGTITDAVWGYTQTTNAEYNDHVNTSYYYYIPSSLKNVTVTIDATIPDAAFNGCSMLENIVIPDETVSIGISSFRECNNLKRLNSSEDGVFNIPQGIAVISDYAFYKCTLVSKITLVEETTYIGSHSFADCSLVDSFDSDSLTTLSVPSSCQEIGSYAFMGMALITDVVISDSVENIGVSAFNGFNSLESITLPFVGTSDGATGYSSVFGYIFGFRWTSSGEISGGKTTNPVSDQFVNTKYGTITDAVWGYTQTTNAEYNKHVNTSYYYYIPSSLKNVTVTIDATIPDAAFNGCSMLENIVIPDETVSIGISSFRECNNLKRLNSSEDGVFNIPQGIAVISDYAFYKCTLVSKITLVEETTYIGSHSFADCSLVDSFDSDSLTTLSVPSSCQEIGSYAFMGMALITDVVISDSVENIGVSAFNGFNSLESITLPFVGTSDGATGYSSVFGYIFGFRSTSSGWISGGKTTNPVSDQFVNTKYGTITDAVWGYTQTTNAEYNDHVNTSYYYYIPSSLKNVTVTIDATIPDAAFNGCSMLENIHLVNCIDSVGKYAFQNCTATIDYLINPSRSGAWDGTSVATSYHGGTGTQQDPYQIFSAKEFVYFLNQIRDGENCDGVYFVLTSNINLGGYAINATTLTEETAFKGVLNGNSHKVFNFTVTVSDNSYNGLFCYVDGTIKNIGFETSMTVNTSKTSDVYVGLIVGKLNGSLENVYATGTLTSTSPRTSYIGGLVGYNNGSILNSYANVNVAATSTNLKCYAAGLVGYNNGSITGSFAYGNVSAKGYADSYSYPSGLVALEGENSTVADCYRYSGQNITKFGNTSTSYNNVGEAASLEEIVTYCKANWNGSVWSYNKTLPSLG